MKRQITELGIVIIVLLLTLTVLPELATFLAIYILYKLISALPLKSTGLLTRFFLAVLIVISLNTLIGFIAWATDIPIGYRKVIVIYSLIAIGLTIYSSASPHSKNRFPLANRDEIFALFISLVIFLAAVLPVFNAQKTVNVAQIIMSGGDNTGHLEILNAIDKKAGYVQETYLTREQAIKAKQVPYPQGWHLNLYIAEKGLEGVFGNFNLGSKLRFYHYASALGLAMMAYFFILLGLIVQRRYNLHKLATYGSVALVSGLLFCGPLFAFFAIGFQTHIAALMILMAELFLLFNILESVDKPTRHKLILLATLLSTSLPYIYLPLWPVALAACALFLIDILGINSRRSIIDNWKLLVPIIGISLWGFGQIVMQIPYLGGGSSALNEPGYILEPNTLMLGTALVACLILALYGYAKTEIRMISQITGVAAVFSLLVLLYQISTVGEPRYYYYKSAYTFIILAALLLAVGLSQSLSAVVRQLATKRFINLILAVAFIFITVSLAWTESSKPFRVYHQGYPYGMSEELADAVITIFLQEPEHGHRTIALGSCNREQDIKAMRLARALTGSGHIGQQRIIIGQTLSNKAINTFYLIKQYLTQEGNLVIISTDKRLQDRLSEYLGRENVDKVRFVDLDYSRQEKKLETCPNLLR